MSDTTSSFYRSNNATVNSYYFEISFNKKPRYIIFSKNSTLFEEPQTGVEPHFGFVDTIHKRVIAFSKISTSQGSATTYSHNLDGDKAYINNTNAKIPADITKGTLIYYKLIW